MIWRHSSPVVVGAVSSEGLCFCGNVDRVDLSNIFLLTILDLPPKPDNVFLFDLWPTRRLWELEAPAVGVL